jgi:predicted phosphodiesterase
MVHWMFGDNAYILIYGHTHEKSKRSLEHGTIMFYNTGGWLVEDCHTAKPRVDPAILQVIDGRCEWLQFKPEKREIEEAAEMERNATTIR